MRIEFMLFRNNAMERIKITQITSEIYDNVFGMDMVGYHVILEELNGSGLSRNTVLNFNSFDGSNIAARVTDQKIVFTFIDNKLRVDQLSEGDEYDVEAIRSEQLSDTLYLTLQSIKK